jgi:hypothetical protein
MSYLAIVLTLLTVLSVGAPAVQAHECYRSGYSSYRRPAGVRFVAASRRAYWRTRPTYTYVRAYYPRYPRVVRVYSYQPYPVVSRYVVYRRTWY